MYQSTYRGATRVSGSKFPLHGWLGLALAALFWIPNWTLQGLRTHWAFFPMWLGYCLAMDGLVLWRTGTSLLSRSWRKYVGLFLLSAPVWWLFEVLNLRTKNWVYLGAEGFSGFEYAFWTTLSFTTVMPAVFGSAELISSFTFIKRVQKSLVIQPTNLTTSLFFAGGLVMFGLLLGWPHLFFPFIWLSLYFLVEPVNIWFGNHSLAAFTREGDWRPIFSLWLGVLVTAFFWEMWNYYSYPKWIYHVPWGNWLHVFEMPLLGYGGYLPFAMELYTLYNLILGVLGDKNPDYVRISSMNAGETGI